MYYYCNKLPEVDTLVVAELDNDMETEYALYVSLPEYNNIQGVISKSLLSKKIKYRNRTLKKLKNEKLIVCYVQSDIENNSDGSVRPVELSFKNIENDTKHKILDRYKYVRQIIRLVKFISNDFKIDYDTLIHNFHNTVLKSITQKGIESIDSEDSGMIDTLEEYYYDLLRDNGTLADVLNRENIMEIKTRLKAIITEQLPVAEINFKYSVWSTNDKETIHVMRSMYTELTRLYKNIKIQYMGAPQYKLILSSVPYDDIDTTLGKIKNNVNKICENLGANGYIIDFDMNNKIIKKGDVSISYPYNVDEL